MITLSPGAFGTRRVDGVEVGSDCPVGTSCAVAIGTVVTLAAGALLDAAACATAAIGKSRPHNTLPSSRQGIRR